MKITKSLKQVSFIIGCMAVGWVAMEIISPPKYKTASGEPVITVASKPDHVWKAKCDEEKRVANIAECMARYYRLEPVLDEDSVLSDREAFERCRASASISYCKWKRN